MSLDVVTRSNGMQEVSNDKSRLLGHQVSGPRRAVSDGTFLGLADTSLHFSL